MFDFNSMTDNELRELIEVATHEQYERKRIGKEKAWRNLKDALEKYLEWGEMRVGGFGNDFLITKDNFNAKDIGFIRLDY